MRQPSPTSGMAAGPLLVAVLVVFTGQQVLTPVLAPLAREMELSPTQLGLVISVAAASLAVVSPWWGRAVDRAGPRRVVLLGAGLALAGLAGFAVVAALVTAGAAPDWLALPASLLTRGLLFGTGLAAIPVAATAVLAGLARDDAERTGNLGRLGAVQGASVALGPALGGLLALAGLFGPVWAAPVLVAVAGLLLARALPPRAPAERPADAPVRRVRASDPRLLPVLVLAFAAYLVLGLVLIVLGFLVQDRLGLDAAGTARTSALVAFAAGVVLILVQGVVVPKLRWSTSLLLRTGTPIATVAVLLLVPASSTVPLVGGYALLALGLSLVMPATAGAAQAVAAPDERGAVAGLLSAVTGVTFVLGPLLGTALYELDDRAPLLASAAVGAVATVLAWTGRRFRTGTHPPGPAAPAPTPDAPPVPRPEESG